MILGFTALMFVVTITLSMASVTQYVTFAAARNYFAATIDANQQVDLANAKYKELTDNATFRPMYNNGWFEIDKEPFVGDHLQKFDYYKEAAADVNQFWGVGTNFRAHVMSMNIPFFGSTDPDEDQAGFSTYLGSYLGREPTSEECRTFIEGRWNAIRNLTSGTGAAYSSGTQAGGKGSKIYYPQMDDGC